MAHKKLDSARTRLALMEPFFASIIFKRKVVETDLVPYAGVTPDGTILYNPECEKTLDVDNLVFLLCHEAMHVVYAHALRKGDRIHEVYNIACDAVINETLVKLGVGKFIEGGVRLKGAEDKTSEQIYDELVKDAKQHQLPSQFKDLVCGSGSPSQQQSQGQESSGKGNSKGKSSSGKGNDKFDEAVKQFGKELSESERKMIEAQTKLDVAEALSVARMTKNIGGERGDFLRKLSDFISDERTPWHELLSRYMQKFVAQDTTWKRPNKRFQTAYLPVTDHLPSMGTLVIGIDTSGSISDKELGCFQHHINHVIEDTRPEKIIVLYCDSSVNRVDEFDLSDAPIELEPCGGGGTDMRKLLKWCDNHDEAVDMCIVFTDGCTPFPKDGECTTESLWVITTNHETPEHINDIRFELD